MIHHTSLQVDMARNVDSVAVVAAVWSSARYPVATACQSPLRNPSYSCNMSHCRHRDGEQSPSGRAPMPCAILFWLVEFFNIETTSLEGKLIFSL